jgi:hypothetical protein
MRYFWRLGLIAVGHSIRFPCSAFSFIFVCVNGFLARLEGALCDWDVRLTGNQLNVNVLRKEFRRGPIS